MKIHALSVGLALAASVPSPARAQCTDPHEPNDSCAQASLVPSNTSFGITLETMNAPSGGNPDWFRTIVPPDASLRLVVTSSPYTEVFTVEVYDRSCTETLARTLVPGGIIELDNPDSAPWEIVFAVFPFPGDASFLGDCEPLSVTLTTSYETCEGMPADAFEPNYLFPPATIMPLGHHPDLTVVGADRDNYLVSMPPGEALLVDFERIDGIGHPPLLTFLDGTSGQTMQLGELGRNIYANNTPHDLVGMRVELPGNDGCARYDLSLTALPGCPQPPDVLEENDTCPGPTPAPGTYPGLGVGAADPDLYWFPEPPPGEVVVAAVEHPQVGDNAVRVRAHATCDILDPTPLHTFPDRTLLVLIRLDSHIVFTTLRVEIDPEQLDLQDPCATYDLSVEHHSQPIGSSYCAAVPHSGGEVARLRAYGSTMTDGGDLVLSMTDGPPQSPGLMFYGTDMVQLPAGNGLRCVGGGLMRLGPPTTTGSNGHLLRVLDLDQGPWTPDLVPGSTWHFQAWFRDGSSSNLSDAVTLDFH